MVLNRTSDILLFESSQDDVAEAYISDLELRIKQLMQFNNIIAHDLRGPIGNIMNCISLYSKSASAEEKDQIAYYIGLSAKQINTSLQNLMETLLQKEQNRKCEVCYFKPIISSVKNQLSSYINDSHALILEELDVEEVFYSPVYLESILYNLISNSLKYSGKEVVPVIVIRTYSDNGKKYLAVQDNGLGLDVAKHKDKIFRFGATFHEGFDSKGVGLYLTKQQIESLGGTITVESEPNKGATFTIRL